MVDQSNSRGVAYVQSLIERGNNLMNRLADRGQVQLDNYLRSWSERTNLNRGPGSPGYGGIRRFGPVPTEEQGRQSAGYQNLMAELTQQAKEEIEGNNSDVMGGVNRANQESFQQQMQAQSQFQGGGERGGGSAGAGSFSGGFGGDSESGENGEGVVSRGYRRNRGGDDFQGNSILSLGGGGSGFSEFAEGGVTGANDPVENLYSLYLIASQGELPEFAEGGATGSPVGGMPTDIAGSGGAEMLTQPSMVPPNKAVVPLDQFAQLGAGDQAAIPEDQLMEALAALPPEQALMMLMNILQMGLDGQSPDGSTAQVPPMAIGGEAGDEMMMDASFPGSGGSPLPMMKDGGFTYGGKGGIPGAQNFSKQKPQNPEGGEEKGVVAEGFSMPWSGLNIQQPQMQSMDDPRRQFQQYGEKFPEFEEGGVTQADPDAEWWEETDDDEIKAAIKQAREIKQQYAQPFAREDASRARQAVLDRRAGTQVAFENPSTPPNPPPAPTAPLPSQSTPAAPVAPTTTTMTMSGGKNPKDWKFSLKDGWIPRNPPPGSGGATPSGLPSEPIDLSAVWDYLDPDELFVGIESPAMRRALWEAGPGGSSGMFGAAPEDSAQMQANYKTAQAGYTSIPDGTKVTTTTPGTPGNPIGDGQPGAGGLPLGSRVIGEEVQDRQGNLIGRFTNGRYVPESTGSIEDGSPGAGGLPIGSRVVGEEVRDRAGKLIGNFVNGKYTPVSSTPAPVGTTNTPATSLPSSGGTAAGTQPGTQGTSGTPEEELIDVGGQKLPLSQARLILGDIAGGQNLFQQQQTQRTADIASGKLKPTMDDRAVINAMNMPIVDQTITAPRTGNTFEFRQAKDGSGTYELWYPQQQDGTKEGDIDPNSGKEYQKVMVKVNEGLDITDAKKLNAYLQGGDWGVRDNPAYNPQQGTDLRTRIEADPKFQEAVRGAVSAYDDPAAVQTRTEEKVRQQAATDPKARIQLAQALVDSGQLQIPQEELRLPREAVINILADGKEQFKDGVKIIQRIDGGQAGQPITGAVIEYNGNRYQYQEGRPYLLLIDASGNAIPDPQAQAAPAPAPTEPATEPEDISKNFAPGSIQVADNVYAEPTGQTDYGVEVFQGSDGKYYWRDEDGTVYVYPAGQKPSFVK